MASAAIIFLIAIWLTIDTPSSSGGPSEPASSSRSDTGKRPPIHSGWSDPHDRSAENKALLSLDAKQLRNKYSSLKGEFAKIEFLAQFENFEPTAMHWLFLEDVGLSEESMDVVEALLNSAAMSDNGTQTRALFKKIQLSHTDPDIREFANDLLEER